MSLQRRSIFSTDAIEPVPQDLGAEGIKPSAELSTKGAGGGLGHSATGDQAVREYHETCAASEGIHDGGSAGISLPTDTDKFTTSAW